MGAGCRMRGEVDDPSTVFVHVGLGFRLEMRIAEALEWIPRKREQLASSAAIVFRRIETVQGDIAKLEKMINEFAGLQQREMERQKT